MPDKPEIEILYCAPCGYLPDALNMLEKLLQEYHAKLGKASLVPGHGGAFEVSINGALVFSKLQQGRFPDIKELREAVKSASA